MHTLFKQFECSAWAVRLLPQRKFAGICESNPENEMKNGCCTRKWSTGVSCGPRSSLERHFKHFLQRGIFYFLFSHVSSEILHWADRECQNGLYSFTYNIYICMYIWHIWNFMMFFNQSINFNIKYIIVLYILNILIVNISSDVIYSVFN